MLPLTIPDFEIFDEVSGKIISVKGRELQLEHSLVSISKWESRWKKAFLDDSKPKSQAETIDYIRCMTLTQNVDPKLYQGITVDNINRVNAYISDTMTATTFKRKPKGNHGTVVTNELIYCWMFELQIPKDCEKWHLNRLLTLIRVMDEKSQPGKKMSKRDVMSQYRSINQARRAKYGTRG